MITEIYIALFLGILSGIVTGLTPGIHINLVSVLVVSFSPILIQITSPIVLAVYIISLAITHTFLDALPSIYLGAPDEAQALSVLPGHRLLKKGEGHNAIIYTTIGSLGSLLLGIILFPFFIKSMAFISPYIEGIMGYLLLAIMIYMILRCTGKRWESLLIFLISGVLGLFVLTGLTLHQPLFPLLSGLFGISTLLTSLLQKSIIPKQKLHKPLTLSTKNTITSVSAATGVGFIAAFLPGFGSAQAAILATNVVGDLGDEGFLSLVGGINTANMVISIAAAYVLDKARNGAIVAVHELIGTIGLPELFLFIGVALVVGGVASILTLFLSKSFANLITKLPYNKIIWGIMIFILLLTFFFDGFIGFIILLTATAIGMLCSSWGVAKNHLMGCLIIPVILYFIL